ncbi:MAG: ROK family protein [Armatimonadota bacterium]
MVFDIKPQIAPPLDPDFRPGVLSNHAFLDAAQSSGKAVPLAIGIQRGDGSTSVFRTHVLSEGHRDARANLQYAERLVKTLLWQRGGHKAIIGGPREIGEHIGKVYSLGGERAFDVDFMAGVYEKPFAVESTDVEKVPPHREQSVTLGRHLDGCRIGFDLGASDRKVSAVVDGEAIFSEEVVWDPRNQSDPRYHFHEIMSGLHRAAARMPRVDAIGGSSAGVIINSRVLVASLFRAVPKDAFEARVKGIFGDMRTQWKVPFEVVNDGEVTALAGSMSLNANSVLGIALGSSEAGGYVDKDGNITRWLNELAFVPVDFNPSAPIDEWSGERGCGGQYFSQSAVVRLAPVAGIRLKASLTPAEKLKSVQDLMAKGDERARLIFESIGCYLGYGIAYYADIYQLGHVLILGRVTSGEGGAIILSKAQEVLTKEFPELAKSVSVNLPDESSRRVGQSVAAASLPAIASG